MDDRVALLDSLRIERADHGEVGSGRARWAGGIVASIALIAVAGWLLLAPSNALTVNAATATAAPGAAAVQRGSILDASGYVVARRQATVSAKSTGRVVDLEIEEGQRVEQGQVIARLDDTNARAALARAEAARAEARARLDAALVAVNNAAPTFARNQQQFARAVISAQDFDVAKASYDAARSSVDVEKRGLEVAEADVEVAERNLDDTVVRAPFAGIVTVKAAQEGEMVSPVSAGGGFTRTGIGTIVDMDSLEVEVDVSESFINRVRPGQNAAIKLNAYPDWSIPGHVVAIIPTADRAKATVRVRVAFEQKDARVLPEMGARVSFLTDDDEAPSSLSAQPAVLIPADAVQADGDTGVVYVIRNKTIERRAVRLGARTDLGQIVLAGIEPGTRIAVGDLSALADGARVHVEE
ncbi:MAG TPA: efflux RND transporter periplasmic adaptor subunit [Gammaproteobacteria bacterium]|nr:efflux RND transporter periplasmic adaptor subunit [Gammaproteobacteria bacterium]